MVNMTAAYEQAVIADSRRVVAKAVAEIISPDIVYGAATYSGAAPTARPEQLHDKVMQQSYPYSSLERHRWILDGSMHVLDPEHIQGQQGWPSEAVSGTDGVFPSDPWVEQPFSGVYIMQACSVLFSDLPADGLPEEFTVSVMRGSEAVWSRTYTGNRKSIISLEGFTVTNPTGIRVSVHKTTLPSRRVRVTEIIAGIYEEWNSSDLVTIMIKQQGDPSCVSLPYGTLTLSMDNSTKRFDPGTKSGVFQSLEERQGIRLYLGVRLDGGGDELAPMGMYYQFQGGWRTGSNDLAMTWSMVDIIGLLTARAFAAPETLPTTLEGWVQAILTPLGVNFSQRYIIDASLAAAPVTANSAEDVDGKTCGEILRFACMAAGGWPRADNATGKILIEPVGSAGSSVTLDNLDTFPSIQANNDVASITVAVYDGGAQPNTVIVPGNQPNASNTLDIRNPFIHTTAAANVVAQRILGYYGGNKLATSGRGNPAAEIGDLDSVEINPQRTVQGRRIYQTLNWTKGVLSRCQSKFLARLERVM